MLELITRLRDACDVGNEAAAKAAFEALDDAHGEHELLRGAFLDAYLLGSERHPIGARKAGMRRLRDRCARIIAAIST